MILLYTVLGFMMLPLLIKSFEGAIGVFLIIVVPCLPFIAFCGLVAWRISLG